MSYSHGDTGAVSRLKFQLPDGDVGKFPQAVIRNSADAIIVGGTIDLTHVANGLYTGNTPAMAAGKYSISYLTYNEIGHTTLSPIHGILTEDFEVDSRVSDTLGLRADYTTLRATRLDNLDVLVSSRQSEASALARATTNQNEHDATQASIAALNNISIADVQTALTNQGYTSGRAPNLDRLDVNVSTRSSHNAAAAADAVWDEGRSGHVGVGSFGEALQGTLSVSRANNLDNLDALISTRATQASVNALPSAVQIGDVVWDELRAGHVTAGSFGEALQGILSTARAANLDNLNATISSRASQASLDALNNISIADVQTALTNQGYTVARAGNLDNLDVAVSTRSTLSAAAAADAVWDESRGAHVGGGTFGEALQGILSVARAGNLDNLDVLVSSRSTQTSVNTIDGIVDSILVDTGTDIPAQISALNDPSAAQIADAVWDESAAAHVTPGSTGEALQQSAPTVSQIADAVWDELLAGHVTVGSAGKALGDAGATASTPAQIADAVWDELIAGHLGAGSAGALINLNTNIQSRAISIESKIDQINIETDPGAIANAVWNESRAAHTAVGSFGESLQGVLSTARAALIDNLTRLDVVVSTRANVTSQNDIFNLVTTIESRLTAGRATNLDNLNATITSRATQASVDSKPSLTQVVDGVWNEPTAGHQAAGTFGKAVIDAAATTDPNAIADAVWDELKAGHAIPGSFGALLDVAISSRASSADMQAIKGAGFSGATDSLEAIRDSISALPAPGDATLANQNTIIANIATRASQTSIGTLQASVNAIPTNPLLTTDVRLNNLDATISSRLSQAAFDVIKGAGFNALTDNLEEIRNAIGGALDLSPVLTELSNIKGVGFDVGQDSLAALEPKIQAAKTSADTAAVAAGNAETAVASKASQVSVDNLQTSVNAIPTNPALATDPRFNNLNATIDSRASQASLNELRGTTFNPSTDSNEAIRDKLNTINPGDATLAQQNAILAALASKASQTSVNQAITDINLRPTNPLLTTDVRLNNLDAAISSRASDADMQLIKGTGFDSGMHALKEISDAIASANLDLTPVLSDLAIIKGAGFNPVSDALRPLNDIAKTERAQIKSDTQALLADGEAF